MNSDQSPAAGETIGQRLKRLRLERGLSQRELAAPGVSYAYISRIEAGTRQPSVKALRKLAAKLEVSADYLETGSDLASDIYTKLGRAYAADGRTDQAIALFESCLEDAESVDATIAARYATLLSYALSDAGDTLRAEEVVKRALDLVQDSGDPYMRVRLYWSMARLAHTQGRESVALSNVRKAIALLEATDDSFHLGRAHLLAARITIARDDADETETHLAHAAKLLGVAPAVEDAAELKILRARVAVAKGDPERAEKLARDALELDGISQADEGFATCVLADARALAGDHDEAHQWYGRAADLLERVGLHGEAAGVCRTWGHMLQKIQRQEDAARVLDRASELMLRVVSAEARTG
jgi:transcriptional regulator with XRE-family HTH domain